MAHFAKYKSADVSGVIKEHDRDEIVCKERWTKEPGEMGYIDQARGSENYTLGATDLEARVGTAIANHGKLGRAFRSDGVALGEWVVTLPAGWPRERDPRELFEVVLWFLQQRYGEGNVPGLWVHHDEGRPHAHIPVIPVAEDGRLRAKDMFTRGDLRAFHDDLEDWCADALGMESVGLRLTDEERQERSAKYVDTHTYAEAQRGLETAQERAQKAAAEADALEARLESLRRAAEAAEQGVIAQVREVSRARAAARDVAAELQELSRGKEELADEVGDLRGRVAAAERDLGRLRGAVRSAVDACTHRLRQLSELPVRMSRAFAESRVGQRVCELLRAGGKLDVEVGGRYDLERRELTPLDRALIAARQHRGERVPDRACTHSRGAQAR